MQSPGTHHPGRRPVSARPGVTSLLMVLAVGAVGGGTGGPHPAAAQSFRPALQEGSAPAAGTLVMQTDRFQREDGSYADAERGLLFVPQDRSRPEEGVLGVVFHRFPARSGAGQTAPPIFRLHGGPGFGGLELEDPGYFEENVEPYVTFTDVIVVGQRGFGPSVPDTECEGVKAPIFDPAVPEDRRSESLREASRKCRAYWQEKGLALEGLNVREAAADVADVARVLGYDHVTLWGESFGSHWAMAVLRDHTDLVVRALLGGTEGPDQTYDMPSGVLDALRRVATDAEGAPELRPWIPDGGLIQALRETIQRVERNPPPVEVEDPETGESREATVTAAVVRSVADGYSSVPDSLHDMAGWPADVLRLHAGRFQDIGRRSLPGDRERWRRIPNAAFFLLDCASGITAQRAERLASDPAAQILGTPAWHYRTACPVWDVDLGDRFRTGFETDVPTLVVHGDWDLSTPYRNAVEVMPSFRKGTLLTVERGTHDALTEAMEASPSFRDAVHRFLRTGELSGIPDRVVLPPVDWVVPAELPPVSLGSPRSPRSPRGLRGLAPVSPGSPPSPGTLRRLPGVPGARETP